MARNKPRILATHEPILHPGHKRPVTRRDFLNAGFITSMASVMMPSMFSLLFSKNVYAKADPVTDCGIIQGSAGGAGKIPFICVDLGGGANMAGSNVLIGQEQGQLNFLSAAGYNKQGLPTSMAPSSANMGVVNTELGLAFHSDSAFLRGIISKTSQLCRDNVNGAVIPARSGNDTSNNPHNPMYGIARAGADGELLKLIGTTNSDSGGRSVAPMSMIDLTMRPTKISNKNDARGLVDTGAVSALMPDQNEAGRVMEAVEKISLAKIDGTTADSVPQTVVNQTTGLTVQNLVDCGYLKTAHTVQSFGGPGDVDPSQDVLMDSAAPSATVSPPGTATNQSTDPELRAAMTDNSAIFTDAEINDNNSKLRSTAAVLKLVGQGYAGAGTIALGGYDYHNSTRGTGERRDFEAGQTIGACLQYAHRLKTPIMVYVFTDGSIASNGTVDNTPDGRGKGVWTGDNSSTSAAFFLVYNPNGRGRAKLLDTTLPNNQRQGPEQHQQLGWMSASGSVVTNGTTPGANSPNVLAEMLVLNYLALHDEIGKIDQVLPGHSLGSAADLEKWIAFEPIVSGTITNQL